MEEEEEEEYSVDDNPLDNDVVLETLAKHIRRRDLLRFRLVCKKWNKSVISRVRSEFQVRLDEASLGRYSALSQFLSLLLSSDQIPFGSYLLLNLRLGNPLLQKLFAFGGRWIKTLRIELHQFDILDVYGLRELLLYRAPNVQTLGIEGCLPEEVISFPKLWKVVSGCRCDDDDEEDQIQINDTRQPILPKLREIHIEGRKIYANFLIDLFRSCPNIRIIKSNKNIWWEKDRASTLIMSAINQAGNYRNLNSLHLNQVNRESISTLLRISENGLRLKGLSFKILHNVDSRQLQGLMDLHQETLTDLSFGEVSGTLNNLVIVFPKMKKLRSLVRTALCKPEILLGPICFAMMTPEIEELSVYAFADEVNWNEYFGDVNLLYPCHSLRKITLPANLSDTSRLDRLGKMFPNVRKVKAECPRNAVITQLWTMWPDLQELGLILSEKNEKVDSIFTGIPESVCNLINLSKSFDEVDLETVRVGPSIANLRGLKKLHLETSPVFWSENLFFCDNEPTCFLSNITGYFGLAFLQNLEDVSISCCEITDDCCLHLAKCFQKFAKIFISARNHVPVYEYDELQ